MTQWEYCEVDYNGSLTEVFFYDEAGEYIDKPVRYVRLGVVLATLGHDGWEIMSTWWRNSREVTYMLKRQCQTEWTSTDREKAKESYKKNHPRDK